MSHFITRNKTGSEVTATHHRHVVQHASVHTGLIKVALVLWEADVIQPPWNSIRTLNHASKQLWRTTVAAAALTRRPVVIQFAFRVVAGAERLQRELQLLPVERLSHAQLLWVKSSASLNTQLLKCCRWRREDGLTFSRSCCDACRSVCPDLTQI